MLYLIDNKYYMFRNREYVRVDVELKNNELNIKPNRKEVIEANDNVKFKSISIDKVIEKLKDKESRNSDLGTTRKSKYEY